MLIVFLSLVAAGMAVLCASICYMCAPRAGVDMAAVPRRDRTTGRRVTRSGYKSFRSGHFYNPLNEWGGGGVEIEEQGTGTVVASRRGRRRGRDPESDDDIELVFESAAPSRG